jgi:S1-C subfamily serine protease
MAAERPVASEQSVVDAIARTEPSVVAISRASPREVNPADQGDTDVDVFGELRQRQATDAASAPVACGVIIDRAGLVLTEYLAVRDGEDHTIRTIEGNSHPAKIRAADPRSGLAVLEISAPAGSLQTSTSSVESRPGGDTNTVPNNYPAISIADASAVRKGEFVISIGNPYAIESDGQPTASLGIITNIAQRAPYGTNLNDAPGPAKDFRTTIHHLGTLLQTDAKLGWSTGGGALINLRGELVGLTTTAAVIAGHEQSAGYAIPMNAAVRRAIESLKQGREVEYGMLGIGFGPDLFAADAASRSHLRIAVVYPTGPAARAGLQPQDVITHVNNRPVADVDGVQLAVSEQPPGTSMDITYQRQGQRETARVTLAKLAVAGKVFATMRPDSWRGMRVDYATTLDAVGLRQAIDSGALDTKGCVLVTDVERDSIAWRVGVRPGMFVSHVAGKRVSTPDEFRGAVQQLGDEFDLKFTTPLSPDATGQEKTN